MPLLHNSALVVVSLCVALVCVVVVSFRRHANAHPMRDTTLDLNEIVWQPEKTNIFIGSPTLLRLNDANGTILAAADRFGSGSSGHPQNVSVFYSVNNGLDWNFHAWVQRQYWSNLFKVEPTAGTIADEGAELVYLMGTDGGQGNIKISASRDSGKTWSTQDQTVLVNQTAAGYYQTGATPTLQHNGMLYRAIELLVPPHKWGQDYAACLVYGNATGDLLDASNWKISTCLPFNTSWIPSSWEIKPSNPGYLEGNAVVAPSGDVYNILRFNVLPAALGNYAVALRFDPTANKLVFDRVLEFPGGHTKFTIRHDPITNTYVSFTNPNDNILYTDQRNVLCFTASKSLFNWTIVSTLLTDDTGLSEIDSVRYTGFHYVDWQFDGPNGSDIIYVIRTGYRGSVSYHNSNRMTFKTMTDWRSKVYLPSNVHIKGGYLAAPIEFSSKVSHTSHNLIITSTTAQLEIMVEGGVFGSFQLNGEPVVPNVPIPVDAARTSKLVLTETTLDVSHTFLLQQDSQ